MKENLRTTKYRNGDLIGTSTPTNLNISTETAPKYQWAYDANESNVDTYGRLYTGYAATDSRGICPTGWHVPTDAEWTTLTTFLGGSNVAGGKLKESGTTHWFSPNAGATNSSGFTALPGGYRNTDTWPFVAIGYDGDWWSSTETSTTSLLNRFMLYSYSEVGRGTVNKSSGASIRCIRDF